MPAHRPSTIGVCPRCETAIDRRHVLIEYERSANATGVYAECPGCREVVTPS